jgi:hypothetical protein
MIYNIQIVCQMWNEFGYPPNPDVEYDNPEIKELAIEYDILRKRMDEISNRILLIYKETTGKEYEYETSDD